MTEFINRIALTANRDAAHRIHFKRGGRLESMPLEELDRQARSVAAHLRSRGVGPGDRVGVMAKNRIEWLILDLAVLKLGGVTAGFDAGRFDPASALQQYGLHHIFVEEDADGKRIVDIAMINQWTDGPELTLPAHDGYRPDDVSAIKFTSGSTGKPKGLEATVGSIDDSLTSVQEMFAHGDGDNILVFFRLALLQQRYWVYSALANGHDVTIANHDDALAVAQAVHPTVIMAVPVFYDEVKKKLESEASVDLTVPETRRDVIQAIFGRQVRYLWTGSAPAGRATLDFYNGCGIPLYQGYGLNETCIVAKNYPGANRIGSVGKILPNKSVRFDSDGMVIVGSRHPVNTHYSWCTPGDNERMFLPTGEVRTHDLGYLDADGYLYILGRVDDIVVLSSGRNVLVPPIEERVKEHPAVHDCVLYGTGRPFLTALISPVAFPAGTTAIQTFIDELNGALLSEQRIHAIIIADEKFTIENGQLTSQFKPVRKEIARRLGPQIAAVYAADVELTSRRNFLIEA